MLRGREVEAPVDGDDPAVGGHRIGVERFADRFGDPCNTILVRSMP